MIVSIDKLEIASSVPENVGGYGKAKLWKLKGHWENKD